jgi:hypothetical protein
LGEVAPGVVHRLAVATGLHVIGRQLPASRLLAGHRSAGGPVPGSRPRAGGLALTLATAVVTALLLLRRRVLHHEPHHFGIHAYEGAISPSG